VAMTTVSKISPVNLSAAHRHWVRYYPVFQEPRDTNVTTTSQRRVLIYPCFYRQLLET
jgi:hypothetical protein